MDRRPLLLVALMLLIISSLQAAETPPFTRTDVRAILGRPGVKLVAVEFYATWCKPCMEAVPEWKRLHEEYRDKGLYFIVVSVGERGKCAAPDWTPDQMICDLDGAVKREWGVRDLPEAFVYSWQGGVLAEHQEVGPISARIRDYYRKTQLRIDVDEVEVVGNALASNPDWVREKAISEIKTQSKFDVVVSSSGRNSAKRGGEGCPDDFRFPPNSTLRIKLEGDLEGERRTASLSIEKNQCVLAAAQRAYQGKGTKENRKSLEEAIRLGVGDLIRQLVQNAQPNERKAGSRLTLEVRPEGARLSVSGPEGFASKGSTRWEKGDLKPGTYKIQVEAEGYEPIMEEIYLIPEDARAERIELERLGSLKITGEPEGAAVEVIAPDACWLDPVYLPVTLSGLRKGAYELRVSAEGYEPETYTVEVRNNRTAKVEVKLRKKEESAAACSIELPPPSSSVEKSAPSEEVRNPYLVAGHAVFWTGLGLAGLGGVFLGIASSRANDYKGGDWDAKSDVRASAAISYAFFAVGGAAMVTGAVLWGLAPRWNADQRNLTVGPTTDGRSMGVQIMGRW